MIGLGSSKGCRTLNIVGTSLEWKEMYNLHNNNTYMYLCCSNVCKREFLRRELHKLINYLIYVINQV